MRPNCCSLCRSSQGRQHSKHCDDENVRNEQALTIVTDIMQHTMGGLLPPKWIEEHILQKVDTHLETKGSVAVMEEPTESERDRGDSVEDRGIGDRANASGDSNTGVRWDEEFENAVQVEPNQTYPLSWAVYKEDLARCVAQNRSTIRNQMIDKLVDVMIDIGCQSPEYQKEGRTQYRELEIDKVIELAWKRVIASQVKARR